MNNDSVIDRAKKLLALAQRGCEGEQENAQKFLDKLLKKHGLSIEDLGVEDRAVYWMTVKNKADHKQILFQILSTFEDVFKIYRLKDYPSRVGMKCTKGQFVEIQIQYEIYIRDFERQFAEMKKGFLSAFIQKNEIFSQNQKVSKMPKTEKEVEDILRAQRMAKEIDKSQIFGRVDKEDKPSNFLTWENKNEFKSR